MLVKNIRFLVPLENIEDIDNKQIDVFVELEDGHEYSVWVTTPRHIEYLMEEDELNYASPGYPFIIVKNITEETIREAIKEYASDDAYWLKLHHFAGKIDVDVFKKLRQEEEKLAKELEEEFGEEF